jgi:hypothetical protein
MKKESMGMGKKTFSSPAKHSKNMGQTAFRKPSKAEHEGKMSKGMKK